MLKLLRELQAIAQSGLAYSKDHYDIERFIRVLQLSAELLATNSSHKYEDLLPVFVNEKGYATPKVGVRGAVFKDEKILLVKERQDNRWSLPGGWCDVNFSAKENIQKEIQEEAGYLSNVIKLISLTDMSKDTEKHGWPYIYEILFLCEITENLNKFDQGEILDVGFFNLKDLPPLSAERCSLKQLEKCQAHFMNRLLATEFD